MKITYTPNPLDTTIELDELEIERFRLKIKIKELEDLMYGAYFELAYRSKDMGSLKALSQNEIIEAAKKSLDPDYWLEDEEGRTDHSKLDSRVDRLLKHYLEELSGSHVGDCTCVPMSCSKCHAESVLGVDTLAPFPGKHSMYYIASVFSRWNPETQEHDRPEVSLDEAIEKLRTLKPTASWSGWEAHADRWAKEVKIAYEYLLQYRNKHFPATPGDAG